MSRKGIGDRVKAKTNVATVRLASALGFQVLDLDHDKNILDNHLSAREAGHWAVSHQHAGHRLRARCVQELDELALDIIIAFNTLMVFLYHLYIVFQRYQTLNRYRS